MKVVLLRDVARLGRRYEIKEVQSGHALNFLIPQKLAKIATPENINQIEALKVKQAEKQANESAQFAEALERLKTEHLTLSADANEQGNLFKGVRADDIARELQSKGMHIDVHQIVLEHPLKELGTHEITVQSGNVQGTLTLEIIAK